MATIKLGEKERERDRCVPLTIFRISQPTYVIQSVGEKKNLDVETTKNPLSHSSETAIISILREQRVDSPWTNVCKVRYETKEAKEILMCDRGTLARIKHFGISVLPSKTRRTRKSRY